MASVKFGSLITNMKGKIGGHIVKGDTTGGVLLTRAEVIDAVASGAKLTKADAGRVMNPQRNTTVVSQSWRDLSDAERSAWNAATPDFPFTNRFGDPYTGSGFQLYMQCNNNVTQIGQSMLAAPPVPETIEPCPAFSTATAIGSTFTVICLAGVPAGYFMTLYACNAQSSGKGFTRGRMKAIVILDSATVFPYNADTAYIAVFGVLPVAGTVWFEGKLTKADAGRQGQPYRAKQAV